MNTSITGRRAVALSILLAAACFGAPAAQAADKIIGIVEEVSAQGITLDSALVFLGDRGKVSGDVKDLSKAKVGFWAEASGRYTKKGLFEAESVKIAHAAPGSSFAGKLGDQSLQEAKKIDGSDKIYRNAEVEAYVRKVGMSLVPSYSWAGQSFSFGIIRDPSLNAFAMPNGSVYVHTGLLAKLDNEAQLAAVLGHEIAHVTQKHSQRQYRTSMTMMIPATIGSILVGVEVQRRTDNPVYQLMAGLGLNMGLSAAVNGYGRTMEDQADRVGLRYTVAAGYDPREAPRVWDTFSDVYGDEGKVENFFWSNHSTNEVRKENLKTEIRRHYQDDAGPSGDAAPPVAPETPAAAKTINAAVYQRTMLDLTRDNAVEDFNVKRYKLASSGFDRVLRLRPGDAVAHHYRGRIILLTEEGEDIGDRAIAEFLKSASLDPKYPDVHRDLGLLYGELNRKADARAHLQSYLEMAPADAKDRKEIEKALRKLE